MRSLLQRIIVIIVCLGIGSLCYRLDANHDFVWSMKGTIIPVLAAMLTLYTTLSMNLVKALYELPSHFSERAMKVVNSMKFELRLELILLLVTFGIMVLFPLFNDCDKVSLFGRCFIDALLVFDVANFLIAIIDTFFGYLDLIQSKNKL